MGRLKTRLIDANALTDDILKSAVMIDDRGIQTGYEIAIELIKKQPTIDAEPRWIPCSERLPEDDTEVVVSCTDDSGDSEFSYTTTGWHFKGMWVVGNERSYFVRAWMPMPKPYEENYD